MTRRILLIVASILALALSFRVGQLVVLSSPAPILFDTSVARRVYGEVRQDYLRIKDITADKIKYGLAKGVVDALGDAHSEFFDPKESKVFMSSLNGEIEGIGAELKLRDGMATVTSPLPNSPAQRAGLKPGDIILKVDGKNLGMVTDLMSVVMKIRGPKGTGVKLTILHEKSMEPIELKIIRDEIHEVTVKWEKKSVNGKDMALMTLMSFTGDIDPAFAKAMKEIHDQHLDHLVIDLRFNGGGYLESAISALSYFIEKGKPVVIVHAKSDEVRNAAAQDFLFRGKIAVLVNDASASAAEIMAGALQDYGLARIIGTQSFGKGTVQEVHPFADGSSLRLTVAEWLTPKKRNIEEKGITPDQIVKLSYEDFTAGKDAQMEEGIKWLTGF